MNKLSLVIASIIIILAGCSNPNVVTSEERALEDKVDNAVNNILFSHDMEALASYNIRKNGQVRIMFADEVGYKQYKAVVDVMRAHPDIPSVRAEQAGMEVCTQKVEIKKVLENSK
jgi:hypothetical protein